jgi:hypothetical protein
MSDTGFFFANGDDNEFNQIPPGHARRNNPFWQW